MWSRTAIARIGGLALVLAMLGPASARAGNFSVINTADSGMGSLRQAILDANGTGVSDNIAINTTGTVTLLSALPTVSGGTTINGPGQSQFTVNGADTFQVLKITSGTVNISGLTIAHGDCSSMSCSFTGGGLLNTGGTVTLSDVAVTDNSTNSQGGGIYNTGTMTLTNSLVNANDATATGGSDAFADGGGVWNAGMLTLSHTTVSGNTASGTGSTGQNAPSSGGIFNHPIGTLVIDHSTIDSNHVTADAAAGGTTNAPGGGIDNGGALTLRRSTVSNNTASATNGMTNTARGAGIFNSSGADVTIDRSTIGGNTVTASDTSQGGGIDGSGANLTITSSTVARNSAAGGANLSVNPPATSMMNTIVSDPLGGGTNCLGGGVSSQGYNLADDTTCNITQLTDRQNVDPGLAASLANNGGPTQTYSIDLEGPAIDAGKSGAGETQDQRDLPRPSDFGGINNASGGDGSDIGAFEFQDTAPPDTIIDTGPGATTHDPTPRFTFHATEAGATFQCKVDLHAFAACNSPRTIAHLADGSHTFKVRARDLAGNVDPSPAPRSFNVQTAAVLRSGATLMVTAAAGAKDNFKITRPNPGTIRVTDLRAGAFPGSGIHVGQGCTRAGDYTANCTASAINDVKVSSTFLADRVLNSTALPSSIDGGPGADALIGGLRADTVKGGPGADTMQGGNGNDVLLARDMTSDSIIDCDGPGSPPGTADKASLDALPKDPNSKVIGCETVSRP